MRRHPVKSVISVHMREHASVYLFVIVLFLMGVIFGAIVVNSLNFGQKQDLYYYLTQFFGQVSKGNIAGARDMFQQSYFHNLKYVAFMWVLGISVIGLPIIFILLFLKGIVVGFTVGFLVNQMGWQGFLLSFVSVMPQNLIIIPAFLVMGVVSISFSLQMVRNQFMKRGHEPIFPMIMRYTTVMILISISLLVSSSLEAYVSPLLMKQVIEIVGNE
ncbi:stage II sporulation protein M [Parageobacillus thermoglucosidasius]|uniref:Stage II sporulation protein M n=1 Tax=Parageobacillus thermoglucosidasius TaxID=1426 RepID=A0AB38R3G0_PARTM|nr:stage II sporulation protein M [Parageobacillus thermoglucosidasius]MED4906122.1 stage II sporulation protein M [Parageobacillus thermoglucosidasius]MED4914405.1 stage II sporulation protein M [Parageobacillus thermoglucosidasius]MED4946832.1 stage II sporulation protein M [Parageobacillus thermoglucosidasius]MED4982985.1 stage II sporulation protein M [Parageobacillus thermoglucosidasius]UOE78193.1 stage II sporulation protein M [Parageobacillus thermoglucosidasius]